MNRLDIDKRMIFSGSRQVKSDVFVANEARSRIFEDRRAITASYIRRNKIDITINDELVRVKKLLDKLRITK